MRLDVWSDVACPWCYIGKRNMERGIAEFADARGGAAVQVEYHSFELAPDTPVDFEGSEIDFLVQHKGVPAERVTAMLDRVRGIAEAAGLHFDFDALQHTNTLKAHQLLHHAKRHGRQWEMTERLFSAYFVEGRHIGRHADLADLAAEVGLDRDDVLRSLQANEHLADVQADKQQATEYGITGVPFFVIDGRYGISGAQPPEVFVKVLAEADAERATTQD
jgi:predicted DsbA family dithiol-disulfide isomerase